MVVLDLDLDVLPEEVTLPARGGLGESVADSTLVDDILVVVSEHLIVIFMAIIISFSLPGDNHRRIHLRRLDQCVASFERERKNAK